MKLYYATGTCSLPVHIVLEEAGFDYELSKVDLKTKKADDGKNLNDVSEKSAVPVLVLDNGENLTEAAAVVQYLADQKAEAGLAPASGSFERVRLQEWLNYIATEMHKSHLPLFKEGPGEQAAAYYLELVKKAYAYVSSKLEGKDYLLGDRFSVADAYLFTVVNWSTFLNIDLSPWPVLVEYQKRVSSRPAVQKVLMAEGLLQKEAA